MKIHKEGFCIILFLTAITAVVVAGLWFILPKWITITVAVIMFIGLCFVTRFFREPKRKLITDNNKVFSAADGEVVVIEKVFEPEYFKDERIQVSVFMSVWNVHINWFPIGGRIVYFRHHQGDFLVAWHPKSSTDNERTTTVIDTGKERIMFRQIAGYIARRIVSYAAEGKSVGQNSQCGFIKFGSRVDIFLPTDAKVMVDLGEKVTGTQSIIAELQNSEQNR